MGIHKATVFIASRFDEFVELRRALVTEIAATKPMAPVDLNDGYARHEPPLAECLARVRSADLMVLLIGDSYGPHAPGRSKSFTHLEYDEASRDGSKTRLLVYRIPGTGTREGEPAVSKEWLREIAEKHTLETLAAIEPKARASEITKHLWGALHDLRFGKLPEEDEALEPETDAPEDAFDDSETESLEAVEAEARGEAGDSGEADVVAPGAEARRPAALAALEQRLEAERATQLGEYGVAIQHLRKALELRPLDGRTNFLLARLYVVLNRQDRLGEAVNLAERAARIEADEPRPYWACEAHLLAARALTGLRRFADAHLAVDEAMDQKREFAKAHLERARIFCAEKRPEQAIASVREAFRYHNSSLRQALRDPHLEGVRSSLRELLREQTALWQREVERLLEVERWLCMRTDPPASEPSVVPTPNDDLPQLRRLGQASISRQRELVSALVSRAKRRYLDSLPETGGSAAAMLVAETKRSEQQFAELQTRERDAAQALAIATQLPPLVNVQVVAPLVIGLVAATLVPWSWIAYITFGVGLGFAVRGLWSSWQRLQRARRNLVAAGIQHSELVTLSADAEAKLTSQRVSLAALIAEGQDAKSTAQAVIDTFEQRALSMPARYQPFPNLRRARPQKLVRVSPKTVEQFEQYYRRRVERDDARFWCGDGKPSDGFGLYRVVSTSPAAIRLSRSRAYEPTPGSAAPGASTSTLGS